MQKLKNWLSECFTDEGATSSEQDKNLLNAQLIIASQGQAIKDRDDRIKSLEKKAEEMNANGGYGYRAQHFEWLNKETLRLSHLVRELSQNNEKLNQHNMELEMQVKKPKKKKNENE
jgi:hypothetical protein